MSDPSPSRRALARVAFVLVQMALALLLLELGLRVVRGRVPQLAPLLHLEGVSGRFADAESVEQLLAESALGFRPGEAGGGARLNQRGFATTDYTGPREVGRLRIVALGDSFLFNDYPLEWMWHAQLAGELDSPADVYSLGVPATSPDFYLRLWQLEGPRTRADVVLVGLTIGNDITDDAVAPLESRSLSPWLRHSLALRALRNGTRLARHRLEADPGGAGGAGKSTASRAAEPGTPLRGYARRFDDAHPSLSVEAYRDLMWKRTVVSRADRAQDLDRWLARLRPVLFAIRDSIETQGARCVFLLFPDEWQIDDALLDDLAEEAGVSRDDIAVARPQQRLRRFFRNQGMTFLDLLPAFRETAAGGARLYRPRDSHWNREGNTLAAREIARFLEREVLPQEGRR